MPSVVCRDDGDLVDGCAAQLIPQDLGATTGVRRWSASLSITQRPASMQGPENHLKEGRPGIVTSLNINLCLHHRVPRNSPLRAWRTSTIRRPSWTGATSADAVVARASLNALTGSFSSGRVTVDEAWVPSLGPALLGRGLVRGSPGFIG